MIKDGIRHYDALHAKRTGRLLASISTFRKKSTTKTSCELYYSEMRFWIVINGPKDWPKFTHNSKLDSIMRQFLNMARIMETPRHTIEWVLSDENEIITNSYLDALRTVTKHLPKYP